MSRIQLKEFILSVEKILKSLDYPEKQLSTISDVLLYATLRGNFQFIIQVCTKNIPAYQGVGDIACVHETPLSMRIDGQYNYGISVMHRAMRVSIDKALKNGFGIVSSFKSSTPGTGPLGYYVEQIAKQHLIGFAFSGSSKIVAPEGATNALLGSNPIAISFPTKEDPIVIDLATADSAVYKVIEAKLLGKTLSSSGYDEKGQQSQDPTKVLQGALKTFGGHKGSALSFAVEALTAPLTGAFHVGSKQEEKNWGNLIYAIDPNLIIEKEKFLNEMSEFSQNLKQQGDISLPGERARKTMEETIDKGYIELADELFEKWNEALKELV